MTNKQSRFYKDVAFTHIKVEKLKSQYIKEEHYNLIIDGIPLDVRLNELYPSDHYLGLIPVFTEWLNTDDERRLVTARYSSTKDLEMLPILMCPDDCDLWCTLVVAEVITTDEYITWNRLGLDKSYLINGVENIGSEVEWLELLPAMKFKKEEYYRALNIIYKI